MNIRAAIKLLKSKLQSLNLNHVDIADYYRGYLSSYIKMYDVIIQRYQKILENTIESRDVKTISFMDFGGGSGILAMLAKLIGIKKVVYVDYVESNTNSCKIIAKLLNIEIDSFLTGSYQNIKSFGKFDIIANYDVLEHLDKPLWAFLSLKECLKEDGLIYMGSGANKYNLPSYYLNKIKHKKVEKPHDINAKFSYQRYSYIKLNYPYLGDIGSKKLAILTRGLTYKEIDSFLDLYLIKGDQINLNIDTNTASPETGIYSENCFDFFMFSKELKIFFKNIEIKPGFYPLAKPKFEKPGFKGGRFFSYLYSWLRFISLLIAPFLNSIIVCLPKKLSFYVAPYYVIIAKR